MNCTRCGNAVEQGAAFCGNCGQQIQVTTGVAQPSQLPPQPSPQPVPVAAQTVAPPSPVSGSPYQQNSGPVAPGMPQNQPYTYAQVPVQQAINTYMVPAVLSSVLCGGLFAIPALIFASQAQSALNKGNYAEAQQKAGQAKTATIVAVVVGAIGIVMLLMITSSSGV